MRKARLGLLYIVLLVGVADAKTRQEVVHDALTNKTIASWTASTNTHAFAADMIFKSSYPVGVSYADWPYVYGGRETAERTASRINNGTCPGGPPVLGSPNTKNIYDWWEIDPLNRPHPAARIAGIDCNGFTMRMLGITDSDMLANINAWRFRDYALNISTAQIQPGDLLIKEGHVKMVTGLSPFEVTEAVGGSIGRVITREAVVGGYSPYSPFPQFAWTSPSADNPELDPLVPVIALEVVSKSSVAPSSVKLVIDEGKPGAVVITPGTTGYALAPSTSNSTHVSVRYEFPPELALSSGAHSVTAYAANDIGLLAGSTMTFQVVPGTNPPTIAWQDLVPPGIFGELKGSNAFDTAPWLHGEGVTLHLWPDRNPLGGFDVYLDDTMSVMLATVPFVAGTRAVDVGDALTGFPDKTGYYARLADVMANTTTMYFHLDKVGPVIETTVTVRLDGTGTGFVFDAAGRAVDSMSGLGGEVLLSTGSGTVPLYAGQSWPTGPAETTYAFTGLLGDYSVLAYDRSGWPGHFNLWLSTWTQTLTLSNRELVNDSASGGNAGAVLL